MELMERIVAPTNVRTAYRRVKRNAGCPGVDGMTVEALAEYLRSHWQRIRRELLDGTYRPAPVQRRELRKPGGGTRVLGIPTALDRLIQQAVLQVLQPAWDPSFSDLSYGFRPGRSAHQAVAMARAHYLAGYHHAVALDLEKFFDRVNHDKMMSAVRDRVKDRRVGRLIRRYLQAGMLTGDVYTPRSEGTPQGGPLSPLLANLLLDQLDRELERRGHRFVRYADDVSIYVKSDRAGRRVLQSISTFLTKKLKLRVNREKSRVEKPRHSSLLGFSIGKGGRVFVSDKSIRRLKDRIRALTTRNRGRRIQQIIEEVADYLQGWRQYFSYGYSKQTFRELTSWIKRRLRCYLWKQWGRAGYRELRQRGVSRDLAWNTCKSHHGPWRLSRSPALAYALPTRYFVDLGLPLLHVNVSRKRLGT
jgi:RNA-directed DNA polymerase